MCNCCSKHPRAQSWLRHFARRRLMNINGQARNPCAAAWREARTASLPLCAKKTGASSTWLRAPYLTGFGLDV